jgi:thiamine monophosphate kinase
VLVHQLARLGQRGSSLVLVGAAGQSQALLDLRQDSLVHVTPSLRKRTLGAAASLAQQRALAGSLDASIDIEP